MSFISDQLRALELQLDRVQIGHPVTEPASPDSDLDEFTNTGPAVLETPRAQRLKSIIKQLSASISNSPSYTSPPISRHRLLSLLRGAAISKVEGQGDIDLGSGASPEGYERELEWLLLSKATILVYGMTLHALLTQTLPLSEDLFYWDEVLSSYKCTTLYAVQASPLMLLGASKEIYHDAMKKFKELKETDYLRHQTDKDTPEGPDEPWSSSMRKFYGLVKNSVRDRSQEWHKRILINTPFTVIRHDIRKKQSSIRRLREMQASALGILIGETLNFDVEDPKEEWKGIIEKAIMLIENIFRNVSDVKQLSVPDFEELVFQRAEEDDSILVSPSSSSFPRKAQLTSNLSSRLQNILSMHLPAQAEASRQVIRDHGRPGILIRYWAPATVLLFTSTTLLRYLANRKAELRVWIEEAAVTAIDFWSNWVIEPTRKILGTIRHSEDSEVALMSRRSLNADMESLERMVVDFALDNPEVSTEGSSASLTPAELDLIRAHVKEGDLTPVLRAYERDLRSPFKGAIRGELVRALLIQIQKTKVDVEVAITGIDRLLKSQELVFGLVGLTPGILTTWGVVRWLGRMFGGRRYQRQGKDSEEMLRVLRHIDRILSNTHAEGNKLLSYNEHGLLLCEVYVLRELAIKCLPRHLHSEFIEEMEELANIHAGVTRQTRVVERVRWAYGRWIH